MMEIGPGPSMGVRSILEDQAGNFWFNSNVNHKYKIVSDDTNNPVTKFKYEKIKGIETAKENDLDSDFMAMVQDDQGDIWMALYDGGIWRYDGSKLSHYPVQHDGQDALVFTIYKDREGALWLGTFNVGALKFNGKTFEKFIPKTKNR